jgi:peptide deformylase
MILMKDIIREGHPTLRQRSEEVKLPLDDATKQTLREMMEFLEQSQDPVKSEELELRPGVGLAAPQINIKKRMIAILTTNEIGDKLYRMLLVNPKIISHSEALTYLPEGEGCLSVEREVAGLVPRYKRIRVRAFQYLPESDETRQIELRVSGYVGIVIQHEIDHLNGILFVDKLTNQIDQADPVIFPIQNEEENE